MTKIRCEYCGRPNDSEREICTTCGANLPIINEKYEEWKHEITPQLETIVERNGGFVGELLSQVVLSLMFVFALSPMITFITLFGVFRFGAELSALAAGFHAVLAIGMVLLDYYRSKAIVLDNRYISTNQGYMQVLATEKGAEKTRMTLLPQGSKVPVVIFSDMAPIFTEQTLPVTRYPIKGFLATFP